MEPADTRWRQPQRRIAVFMYGYDEPGSGAQRRTLTLTHAFAQRGHHVDVVVVRATERLRAALSPLVRLVELDAWSTRLPLVEHSWRAMAYGSVSALARYLRREQPDVLLSAATHINLVGLWGWRLARVETPLVLRESNTPPARRFFPSIAYRFYPWAAGIVAVSRGVAGDVAARVRDYPSRRIVTIYNPVVTRDMMHRAQAPLHHPWFTPDAPPVLLGVGRIAPQKDFPTLLKAFARVRATRPARLMILGHGEPKPLAALAAGLGVAADVAFPGFVANPLPYMVRAAACVCSSAWEGLPGVLIEAMACGCPVVSTDCPSGPAEILDQGTYGPLVPVGNPAALAEAILSVLAAPPDRERLRARAAMFSAETAADRYLEVLLHLCKGNGGAQAAC
ncbi:MAG: glycosyltransferase [Candidatus Binatia bacterium]